MVALMTGQPALGKVGQQDWCAGGASIDQILLARSPLLGGPASAARTAFGSLQLAADIRADRDEVAPRVMSYLDPLPNQTDIAKARQPLYPETQPLAVFNRLFGGALPPGTTPADTARLLAQKLSVLDFMRADLARLRTLIPASEKDRLAVARRRHPEAGGDDPREPADRAGRRVRGARRAADVQSGGAAARAQLRPSARSWRGSTTTRRTSRTTTRTRRSAGCTSR